MFGQLVPVKDGDAIALEKKRLRIGRHKMCDIVLKFNNVSEHHCLLEVEEGYWFVKDLNSTNGVKVQGKRIQTGFRKRVDPEARISVANHDFILRYDPNDLGAYGTPPPDESTET